MLPLKNSVILITPTVRARTHRDRLGLCATVLVSESQDQGIRGRETYLEEYRYIGPLRRPSSTCKVAVMEK